MVMLWNLVVLVGFVVERGGSQKAGHLTYCVVLLTSWTGGHGHIHAADDLLAITASHCLQCRHWLKMSKDKNGAHERCIQ